MSGRASFPVALVAALLGGAVHAAPKSLAVVGRVSVEGGVINDAFEQVITLGWPRSCARRA